MFIIEELVFHFVFKSIVESLVIYIYKKKEPKGKFIRKINYRASNKQHTYVQKKTWLEKIREQKKL